MKRYLEAHGIALRYHPTPLYALRSVLRALSKGEREEWTFPAPKLLDTLDLPAKRAARYREFVLRPGDRVAVVGQAAQHPDPTAFPAGGRQPAIRVVLGEAPNAASISNLPGVWS